MKNWSEARPHSVKYGILLRSDPTSFSTVDTLRSVLVRLAAIAATVVQCELMCILRYERSACVRLKPVIVRCALGRHVSHLDIVTYGGAIAPPWIAKAAPAGL